MYKKISLILLLISFSSASNAESNYENALMAYEKNDVEASYIHLKNALAEDQDNLPAKILMGHVLLRKGLFNEAIEEFRDAIALGADINPFVYEMARALLFNNKFEQALELANSTALNPENKIKMLLLSSNAFQGLKKRDEALNALLLAYAFDNNRLSTITSLSSYYLEQRLFKKSRYYLDKALDISPENNRVWHLNGEFFNLQGNGSEALAAFKKSYELNPTDPVAMRSLANQYFLMNKLDDALIFTDKILASSPFDTYTELLKSRLLIKNGQNEEAQIILQTISARLSLLTENQKNANPSMAFVSGSSAFLQGNYEQAQKDLIYYVNAKPEDLSGINMLVEIYQSQKQHERVEALLERFEPRIKKDLFLALNLYNIYLKNNKIYKAKSLLNELERYYSNNLLIISARANYLVSTQRTPEAIELLKHNRPVNLNGMYELNLANLYLSIPDFVKANTIADKLLAHNNQTSQYLILKGVILSKQRQWKSSITYFDKVLVQNAKHFAANYNKVTALAALRKFSEALDVIYPMIEAYPNHYDLLILFAKLNRDNGELAKAEEILTGILKRKPRMLVASDILYGIYFQQGKYSLALEEAERLAANSFLDMKFITYKANALIKLERYQEANVQLGKIRGLAESARDFYQLSVMQTEAKYYDDALTSLEGAIKKDSNSRLYYIEKAKLLLTLKRENEAQSELDKLAKENPNDANLKYAYGLLYVQQQQYTHAYNAFDQAFTIDHNFTGALIKLYMLAQQGINSDKFSVTLNKLVKSKPENTFTRNLLADFYLSNNKTKQALKHYLLIESANTVNQSNVLNNIANIYAKTDANKALTYIERAYSLKTNSPDILDTYGWILSLTGDYIGSLAKLRQASAINANDPLINYHLGMTLEKMGRLEDAKIELTKAVNMKGRFSEREDAQKLLESIE